jgi:hypothetical protein
MQRSRAAAPFRVANSGHFHSPQESLGAALRSRDRRFKPLQAVRKLISTEGLKDLKELTMEIRPLRSARINLVAGAARCFSLSSSFLKIGAASKDITF